MKLRFHLQCLMLLSFASALFPAIQQIDSTQHNLMGENQLDRQTLSSLPFRGANYEFYGFLNGVVTQDYRGTINTHVRGSRPDEIAYTFEGIDIRSDYDGRPLIQFIPEALQQVRLDAAPGVGVSHASAVFQHKMRTGGPDFRFDFTAQSDRFTPNYTQRFNTFSYGFQNYLLTASGKIWFDNICFLVAAEQENYFDHYRRFWDGFSYGAPEHALYDYYSGYTLEDVTGLDRIIVKPGNIPKAKSEQSVINGLITADFNALKLKLIHLSTEDWRQLNETPITNMFDLERVSEIRSKASVWSVQADYRAPFEINVHAQLDFLNSETKTYDPNFGDDFMLYYDSAAVRAKGLTWDSPIPRSYESKYLDPPSFYLHSFRFRSPGEVIPEYSKMDEDHVTFSGFLQRKLYSHDLTFGFETQQRTIRLFDISSVYNYISHYSNQGENLSNMSHWQIFSLLSNAGVNGFGYDAAGNEVNSTTETYDAPRKPKRTSFYIEDRFELDQIRFQLGMHYVKFMTDALMFTQPEDIYFERWNSFRYLPLTSVKKITPTDYFLPRLALEFQPGNRFRFFLNWGQYAQHVRYSDFYASRTYLDYHVMWLTEVYFLTEDLLAFDTKPVKSEQTTFGVNYSRNDFNFQLTAFLKRMTGHLEADLQKTTPASSHWHYEILKNSGDATARGIELNARFHRNGFGAQLNYTLSDVRGQNSYSSSNILDIVRDEQNLSKTRPQSRLEYNQRHRGMALLAYQFNADASFMLRNMSASALFHFNSGHNFTIYDGGFG